MGDVKVHYNSSKPAQLKAHAYAQGNNIHLAPGQQRHLPHEAWHVVQQKQGRVKPTMQMKKGININDDAGLEKEADVMGAEAMRVGMRSQESASSASMGQAAEAVTMRKAIGTAVLQPVWIDGDRLKNYMWHEIVEGLKWFTNSETGLMWYEIFDETLAESASSYLLNNAGKAAARTIDNWLVDAEQWQPRPDTRYRAAVGSYQDTEVTPATTKGRRLQASKQRAAFKKALRQLGPTKKSEDFVQDKAQAVIAKLTMRKESNYQCDGFAKDFQAELTGKVRFLPLMFKIDPIPKGKQTTMTLNEPGHPYDQFEVGSKVHYATLINFNGTKMVYDNHHVQGVELQEYMSALQFDLYVDAKTSKGLDNPVFEMLQQKQALMTQGRVVVLVLSPGRPEVRPEKGRPRKKITPKGFYSDLAGGDEHLERKGTASHRKKKPKPASKPASAAAHTSSKSSGTKKPASTSSDNSG